MRILYGVSPIGLGHAARAVAVGKELEAAGHEVAFATGGNCVEFLRSYGFEVEEAVEEPVPKVVGGVMRGATLWYVRYWRGYRATKRRLAALISTSRPDLVVGDEEFAGVQLAGESGIPRALMTDELELGFGRTWVARRVERRVSEWYASLLNSVPLLLVPDFGEDTGNRRYVGPIVRPRTMTGDEVRRKFSLPPDGRMVLFSMSGAGLGAYFLERTLEAFRDGGMPGTFLAISGNRGARVLGERVFDLGVVRDNQDLVGAADLVVSTAGKSTIDEAASAGTPVIALPIKGHAEQERNAAGLGYRFEDAARLRHLMVEKLGVRSEPARYVGAETAANLIVNAGATPS